MQGKRVEETEMKRRKGESEREKREPSGTEKWTKTPGKEGGIDSN